MKLYKENRRKRALERFRIQTETEWNGGQKGSKKVSGTYDDYVERKKTELASLEGHKKTFVNA